MWKLSSVTTAALVLVLLSGVAASRALGAETPLNPKCPVLTDEDVDPEIVVTYEGKKVFFCCPQCRKQFLENPAAFLKNLPQFSSQPIAAAAPAVPAVPEKLAPAPPPKPFKDRLLTFLGKFHPAVVHFPIALVLGAALAELLFLVTGRPLFADSARVMVVLGALGSIVAGSLGLLAALDARYPADLMVVLGRHRWAGAVTSVLTVLAAVCGELSRRTGSARWLVPAYRVLLCLAAVGVALTGYLGGTLVYGPEHYAWH